VPVPFEELAKERLAESSEAIRERVVRARHIQEERFKNEPGIYCNAQMTPRLLRKYAQPDAEGFARLRMAMDAFSLSARAYDRILKVSRTIADLAGEEQITSAHIFEAIHYRNLDKESWAG
jgi:magnesium chelatase family protein